jgi:hypothetical protein
MNEIEVKRDCSLLCAVWRWCFLVCWQGDIQATWGSIMNNLDMNNEMAPVNRKHPGHYNDPDMCARAPSVAFAFTFAFAFAFVSSVECRVSVSVSVSVSISSGLHGHTYRHTRAVI